MIKGAEVDDRYDAAVMSDQKWADNEAVNFSKWDTIDHKSSSSNER